MYLADAATHTEMWPFDKFVPYVRNPRKNDAAVDRMCGSIREFGFKIPCLARSDGEVVDGHLRLKAARKLGITKIPVILCDEWTAVRSKHSGSWSIVQLRGQIGTRRCSHSNCRRSRKQISIWA